MEHESLEQVITRLILTARRFGKQLTPESLAIGIIEAGWTHHADVATLRNREAAERLNTFINEWYDKNGGIRPESITAEEIKQSVERIIALRGKNHG